MDYGRVYRGIQLRIENLEGSILRKQFNGCYDFFPDMEKEDNIYLHRLSELSSKIELLFERKRN